MFTFKNRNSRKRREICSKLTLETPEQYHWRHSGVFIVNFEHISHLFLMFLLLTLNKLMLPGLSHVSVVQYSQYLPRFSYFIVFLPPKGSWNKSTKYEKFGKYWPSCTPNRAITNTYFFPCDVLFFIVFTNIIIVHIFKFIYNVLNRNID